MHVLVYIQNVLQQYRVHIQSFRLAPPKDLIVNTLLKQKRSQANRTNC